MFEDEDNESKKKAKEKEQKVKKNKIKTYLIISVVLSCIGGVIATIIFLSALITCDPDFGCYISTSVLQDWWVIPLGFLLGFIGLPIIYVINLIVQFFHDYT